MGIVEIKTLQSPTYGLLYVLSQEKQGDMLLFTCEDWQGRRVYCSRRANLQAAETRQQAA